ncbi:uncharacterized protein LOC132692513 [Panthera onca]
MGCLLSAGLWAYREFRCTRQVSSLTLWIVFLFTQQVLMECLQYIPGSALGKPEEPDSLGATHHGASAGLSVRLKASSFSGLCLNLELFNAQNTIQHDELFL